MKDDNLNKTTVSLHRSELSDIEDDFITEDEDEHTNTLPFSRKEVVVPGAPGAIQRVYIEIHGLAQGKVEIELNEESSIVLGRSASCEMHLPLANISRRHSRVFCSNAEYYVEDNGSTNGTYVNGTRIKKCVLRNGDQIEIGEAKIIFVEISER